MPLRENDSVEGWASTQRGGHEDPAKRRDEIDVPIRRSPGCLSRCPRPSQWVRCSAWLLEAYLIGLGQPFSTCQQAFRRKPSKVSDIRHGLALFFPSFDHIRTPSRNSQVFAVEVHGKRQVSCSMATDGRGRLILMVTGRKHLL